MPVPRRTALPLLLFALLVLGGSLALDGGRSSRADAQSRTVTVSPDSGLQAGQEVSVSWSGFEPNGIVYLHQCLTGATRWQECAEVSRAIGASDANGAGSLTYRVWGGEVPQQPNIVGPNDPLFCEGGSCSLHVSECGFSLAATQTAAKVLNIGTGGANPDLPTTTSTSTTTTTPADADPSTRPQVDGLADSDSQLLTSRWVVDALSPPLGLDVELTLVNSPTANQERAFGASDFSVTNLPLTAEQVQSLADRQIGIAYVPVALNALVMGYGFQVNGIPVVELRFSAETMARLYTGEISFWNSPYITDDNGGCAFPGGTRYPVPAFRTDQAGSNHLFSSWLNAQATEIWQPVVDFTGGVSPVIGINDSKVFGQTGAAKLAEFIAIGDITLGDRPNGSNAGRLAFVDRSLAREEQLTVMALRNAAGEYVYPTDEAILKALEVAEVRDDGIVVPDFTDTTPGVYPMPLVTYVAVPTSETTTFTREEGAVLRDFLTYVTSDEGQQAATELGFVALPDPLQQRAATEIAKIPTPENQPPTNPPPTEDDAEGDGSSDGFGDGGFGDGGDGFFDSGFADSGSGFTDGNGFSSIPGSTSFSDTGTADTSTDTGTPDAAPTSEEPTQPAAVRLVSSLVGAGGAG
ncbi:MAG: neocarzinostatin apoprotein domain-containing protein, partial [Acidimicrobiales bacterium]|nr:neocarzinostatin apoprotein domain-containing protein [Acidimicrobiales bacterium]